MAPAIGKVQASQSTNQISPVSLDEVANVIHSRKYFAALDS